MNARIAGRQGEREISKTNSSIVEQSRFEPGTLAGASRCHSFLRMQWPRSRHPPISQIPKSIIRCSTNVGRFLSVAFLRELPTAKHAYMWEKEDEQKKNSCHATDASECSEHHLARKSDVQCGEHRANLICW